MREQKKHGEKEKSIWMKKYDNEYQMRKNFEQAVNEIKSKLSHSAPIEDGKLEPAPPMQESTVTTSFKDASTDEIKRIVERTLLLSNDNLASGPSIRLSGGQGEKEDSGSLR